MWRLSPLGSVRRSGSRSSSWGDSAIEQSVPVGTKDMDVLISSEDWSSVDQALEHRPDATPLDPMSGTIRGTQLSIGGALIDVEFLSGEPFCGNRTPTEFLRFVREHGSRLHLGTHYATPEGRFLHATLDRGLEDVCSEHRSGPRCWGGSTCSRQSCKGRRCVRCRTGDSRTRGMGADNNAIHRALTPPARIQDRRRRRLRGPGPWASSTARS
jgi:hypothetical protein